jgi:hypothetical protein
MAILQPSSRSNASESPTPTQGNFYPSLGVTIYRIKFDGVAMTQMLWIVFLLLALVSTSCSFKPDYAPKSAYDSTRFPQTRTVNEAKVWVSWSSSERLTFVRGFLAGYRGGYEHGCDYLIALTQSRSSDYDCLSKKPQHLPISDSQALLNNDYSTYATSMTAFYETYPQDDDVPITILLYNIVFNNKTAAQFHNELTPRTIGE